MTEHWNDDERVRASDINRVIHERDEARMFLAQEEGYCNDLLVERYELRVALAEALNRWEWFAQRFRDRIGGLAAADEFDYPRIAELRKLAEGA